MSSKDGRTALKRININKHKISRNNKSETKDPPIRIQEGSKITYVNEVLIEGPAKVIYRPNKPLSCGAQVWIETEGQLSYEEDDGSKSE